MSIGRWFTVAAFFLALLLITVRVHAQSCVTVTTNGCSIDTAANCQRLGLTAIPCLNAAATSVFVKFSLETIMSPSAFFFVVKFDFNDLMVKPGAGCQFFSKIIVIKLIHQSCNHEHSFISVLRFTATPLIFRTYGLP